jgi:hypothetical protein
MSVHLSPASYIRPVSVENGAAVAPEEGHAEAESGDHETLGAQLRRRQLEIEESVLARVSALSRPEHVDPQASRGLREVVSASIDYGLAATEGMPLRLPPVVRKQARVAAQARLPLETVLRCFFAGQLLLSDFLVEEARLLGVVDASLQAMLRNQAGLFDQLIEIVAEEYNLELKRRPKSTMERRTETVRRLLQGEAVATHGIAYDFGAHHVAAIASGAGAEEALRELGSGRQVLLARPEGNKRVWAWFGAQSELEVPELSKLRAVAEAAEVTLAFGDPHSGLDGWRVAHQQAKAAFSIAARSPSRATRYREVALLATAANDDLLAASLRCRYLDPLATDRDGGKAALETLRSYFAAGRNGSSAAAALGITRRTVANRLRSIEKKLGCSLLHAGAEIETALRLHDLDVPTGSEAGSLTAV